MVGPYGNGNTISPDEHSVLVDYELPGDADETEERIDAPVAAIERPRKAHPAFFIDPYGSASIEKEFEKALDTDFQKAEVTSLPVTLIILAIAFGTLVAAGLPVAARDHGGRGDAWTDRPDQPDLPRVGVDQLGHPADRTGRRGGLLPVLHPAGTRGTSQPGAARRGARGPRPRPAVQC